MNFIKKGGNSVLGMQFRTCKNFWTSTDFSLVESPKILINTKATPPLLRLRFASESTTNQAQICNFSSLRANPKNLRGNPPYKKARFCDSQNLVRNNPCEAPKTKFLLLLAFAKKKNPTNPQDSNPPNNTIFLL